MNDKKSIKTTKLVYPQIYSYIVPELTDNQGWQKIGYTERKDVHVRIREQTETAMKHFNYQVLWTSPAVFRSSQGGKVFFSDKDFHRYLVKTSIRNNEGHGTEWFYFNGTPYRSRELFEDFAHNRYSSLKNTAKLAYELRPEQMQAVEQTLDYVREHYTADFRQPNPKAEFLWNAKPRFGKTLTTYDFAKKFGARNVLVVTNRPSIATSWFDDFEKFIEGYYFISTTDSLKERRTLSRDEFNRVPGTDKKQITFLSLQDLKGGKVFGGNFDKLRWVADLHWDLLVIDEAHEGVDTSRTDEAFDKISRKFTLHLSGTPFRAIADGKFSEQQIFNWTYIDEQKAKRSEITAGNESGSHTNMPDMRLFTYKISDMTLGYIEEGTDIDEERADYTFDLNEFFRAEGGKFVHENDVKRFLDTLTSNHKYPFSTPELRDELKHTFWLVGNRVASAKAMEKLLRKHPVFENFHVILAAGDGKPLDEDGDFLEEANDDRQNEKAFDRVRKAIKKYDKTITLSVGQLTTGVTVKEWSAVLMLSDIKAEALYMQAIFRAQNPYEFVKNGELHRKKSAYVFDFAPNRVLQVYDSFANSLVEKSATGKVTEEECKENIAELLNFFPVISEDSDGTMIELDAEQVLTFPKAIVAREVVNRCFVTNLLFKNLTNIFNIPSEVIQRVNKTRATNDAGRTVDRANDLAHDSERKIKRDKRISANRDKVFTPEKIYGVKARKLAEEVISQTPATEVPSKLAEAVTTEILEPVFEKWVETYSPTKKEIAEKKKEKVEKIKAIAEEFVASSGSAKDEQKLYQDIASEIEDELPKDLVDNQEQEEFEKEEMTELDQLRAKLRTFAKAIPMMVMASQNPQELTIDNIEETISDEDFSELFSEKGCAPEDKITKEDFRIFRDGGDFEGENGETVHFDGFFDKYVFNASIKEFEQKRNQLADYLSTTQTEDIFSYIRPQRTNQIFTPRRVVNQMLNILEAENPGIFENPHLTFCDLYVKSGLYLAEIAKRLYRGLEKQMPNPRERTRHIFEHQLYGYAPTRIIYDVATNYVFGGFSGISGRNLKLRDLTDDFKAGKELNMKFDIVIGNPPYQENDNGARADGSANASASPIYQYFVEGAKKVSDKQCFVIPSRWTSGAGKGLKKFSEAMLTDRSVKHFSLFTNSKDIFPNNDIKGGICYFMRDEDYDGETHIEVKTQEGKTNFSGYLDNSGSDVFIPWKELADILEKVKKKDDITKANFQKIVSVPKPYGLGTDFFVNQNKYHLPPVQVERKQKTDLEIFGLLKAKRVSRFVSKDYPLPAGDRILRGWKVFLPYAYGCGAIGEEIPSPILGSPIQICTETYLQIGKFKARDEAEACLKYIKTKFFRAMVGILKTTQHSTTALRLALLQNFTAASDIDWSQSIADIDCQLYKKYGPNEREIRFIEEKVKEMK